jgi:SLT domain-containing protein
MSALLASGSPVSWINSLLRRMNQESGGNPNAINLWDSNAKAGHPSQGLMQTIPGTFNAYAGAYKSRGILDPFANIYAAIKYTVSRYGSGPAGWDRAGGYGLGGLISGMLPPTLFDSGGVIPTGLSMHLNKTRKPEAVFAHNDWRTMKNFVKESASSRIKSSSESNSSKTYNFDNAQFNFPNVKTGEDAEKFLDNLEGLVG